MLDRGLTGGGVTDNMPCEEGWPQVWSHCSLSAWMYGKVELQPRAFATITHFHIRHLVLLQIPPAMGYGEAGSPPKIPGNAMLVFETVRARRGGGF